MKFTDERFQETCHIYVNKDSEYIAITKNYCQCDCPMMALCVQDAEIMHFYLGQAIKDLKDQILYGKNMKQDEMEYEESSGNIFRDLGLDEPDARLFRSKMKMCKEFLEEYGHTVIMKNESKEPKGSKE